MCHDAEWCWLLLRRSGFYHTSVHTHFTVLLPKNQGWSLLIPVTNRFLAGWASIWVSKTVITRVNSDDYLSALSLFCVDACFGYTVASFRSVLGADWLSWSDVNTSRVVRAFFPRPARLSSENFLYQFTGPSPTVRAQFFLYTLFTLLIMAKHLRVLTRPRGLCRPRLHSAQPCAVLRTHE